MRRLLVEKDTIVPQNRHVGVRSFDHSNPLLGLFLGVDRRYRYTKMVERIYGEPEAADRLLLKTLYLSQLMEMPAEYSVGQLRVAID